MKRQLVYWSGVILLLCFSINSCKKDSNVTLPVVSTIAPKYFSSTLATLGCSVKSDGGAGILCGIYLGIEPNSETTGVKLQIGSDTGTFIGQITNLLPNKQYYFKAYATNSKGEALGDEVDFTTPATVTDYENHIYNTVKIGNQIWMAENLRTTHYLNGELIPTTNPSSLNITSEISPKYQWSYSGDDANSSVYGKLYTYYTVTDSRKVCPAGWHLPSDTEWTTLLTTLGGYQVAGSRLKEHGNTHWLSPYNTDATNESCYTALPGGYRDLTGTFYLLQNDAYWWSSTESEAAKAWGRTLNTSSTEAGRTGVNKSWGLSVRCVKD
jgi:uncharacterized protein (TIGR02145 family)